MGEDETRRAAEQERVRRQREQLRAARARAKGADFHRGMALLRGETPERGWSHEHVVQVPGIGERHIDSAHPQSRQFREYKDHKRLRADKDLRRQIQKDRGLLQAGWRGQWVIAPGTRLDVKTAQLLKALEHEFPGRFAMVRATRHEKTLARVLVRQIERKPRQLELIPVHELRREQRPRGKELARQPRQLELIPARELREAERARVEKIKEARQVELAKTKEAREAELMRALCAEHQPRILAAGEREAAALTKEREMSHRAEVADAARETERVRQAEIAKEAERVRQAELYREGLRRSGLEPDMVAMLLRTQPEPPDVSKSPRERTDPGSTRAGRAARARALEPRGLAREVGDR